MDAMTLTSCHILPINPAWTGSMDAAGVAQRPWSGRCALPITGGDTWPSSPGGAPQIAAQSVAQIGPICRILDSGPAGVYTTCMDAIIIITTALIAAWKLSALTGGEIIKPQPIKVRRHTR